MWLARMRVRLYRFLLRCYGKADWRTTPAPVPGSPRHKTEGVVFDQPEVRFLHGKPAKTPGKIQAVLKFVASAQEPVASGNYSRQAAHAFVAIASESSHSNTLSLFTALKREGIDARHVVRDGEGVVEVRGIDYYRAQWLLSCFQAARSSRRQPLPQFVNELAKDFGVGLATAPFIGIFASMMFMAITSTRLNAGFVAVTAGVLWILVFMAFRIALRSPRRD
jgi:hypothetical protein